MREAFVDTSENHIGILLAEGQVVRVFTKELRQKFGKQIHMRELNNSEKFAILRIFNKIFQEKEFSARFVKIDCIEIGTAAFWRDLIKYFINQKIDRINADYEVQVALKKHVNGLILRQLNLYTDKETLQLADIIAYGNSHHDLVKNIWKNVPMKVRTEL